MKEDQTIVQAVSLRDQVTNILRQKILSGELGSGDKLSERQISAALQVSTTPVKEAFRVLQSEGLIITIQRKGTFVADNLDLTIVQFTYLRSAIDGIAAYFAAKNATQEQITTMQRYLDQAKKIINQHDEIEKLSEVNEKFHQLIRDAAGFVMVQNLGKNLQIIDSAIRRRVNIQDYKGILRRQEEHQKILDCIVKGDSEGAEQAIRKNIREGIKFIDFNSKIKLQ